jgi:predicted metal-dependent hydrolase
MNEESPKGFRESLFIALNLFNNHEWYEAHDAFEAIWNTVDGDERQVIQGILQVSVSQFHLSKGNLNGATILLGEGLGRIKTRTKINLGIDLESFCVCLEDLLRKLQNDEILNDKDQPFLKPLQ